MTWGDVGRACLRAVIPMMTPLIIFGGIFSGATTITESAVLAVAYAVVVGTMVFKEMSWHFDLARRCDGTFTYDGGEQYGPGKTEDNTYYGKSSYDGLSPTATYVLTYALPLKKLCITGKEANPAIALNQREVFSILIPSSFSCARYDADTGRSSGAIAS